MPYVVVVIAVVTVVLAGLLFIVPPWREARRRTQQARLQKDFRLQRERLEALFVEQVMNSGKPRGLRWREPDFHNPVVFARDRKTSHLMAFVGLTVSFEAIEGGGMEDVPAVDNLRAATALFRHDGHVWQTDGRVLFNLEPAEAVAYYERELESLIDAPNP